METKFINRNAELSFLNKKYASKNAEFIIIYGRRRIGKTALLNKFLENRNGIYFMGRLESKEDLLKRFNILLAEFFNDSKLFRDHLQSWDAIFEYINEKSEKKLIIILDEFPFIVEKFPEIISIMQDKWDNLLKNSKSMIILSGSSISMMEKYTLDYNSPLYGRRTGQWKVGRMNPKELYSFFPNYSLINILTVYSCLDTIPGYLTKFSKDKEVWVNITEQLLSKGEFLYEEVDILLREELRDTSNYMSILASIAGGLTTFNEITLKTNLDKSLISKYISKLETIDIIDKLMPITEKYKNKLKAKGALYYIKDNFIDFYFRFVYINKDSIERGLDVTEYVKKNMDQYMGKKFEKFIIESFSNVINEKFQYVGKWWHKEKEIDIVAINEEETKILFAECKWSDNVDAKKVLFELKEKAKSVLWQNKERKETYYIFAKSFNNKKVDGVTLIDLNDIEKALKQFNST